VTLKKVVIHCTIVKKSARHRVSNPEKEKNINFRKMGERNSGKESLKGTYVSVCI
jgi:hypothetical protein